MVNNNGHDNNNNNNNNNTEELISISSLNSMDRGIVFYHSTISAVNVTYTQFCKNCEKTKVIATKSSPKILTSLKTDENDPGEGNILINNIKDITQNGPKVKSNFDQITSVDEDDDVFMRVLEFQNCSTRLNLIWKNGRTYVRKRK